MPIVKLLVSMVMLVLTACAGVQVAPTATPAPTEGASAPTATPISATVAANAPTWLNLPVVNVRTGETFALADFAGKTVYVHPMARW